MEILLPSVLNSYPASPSLPFILPPPASSSIFSLPATRHTSSSIALRHAWSRRGTGLACSAGGGDGEDGGADGAGPAPGLGGEIPRTSGALLKHVSSRDYAVRGLLEHAVDSATYDLLEANPWRGDSKLVYVLAQKENKILTMRTRRSRNEVERELDLLFPKRGSRCGKNVIPRASSSQAFSSSSDTHFQMLVEDVCEGVLVFEDEEEASRYCRVLEGHDQSCMGVAELDASDVFALCHNIKALVVLFRHGRVPPLPDRLQQNLMAKKTSLEDQS